MVPRGENKWLICPPYFKVTIMQIELDKVVTIDFTMYDADTNELLETSEKLDPVVYLHGYGELPEGLEDALEGKQAGDEVRITLDPDLAYGERDEELVQAVSRDQFEGIQDLEIGMRFEAETEEGPQVVRIVGFEEDDVIIDANELYAGRTVKFDVTILGVRDATEDELEHGHAHGEGCAHDEDCDDDR
jgi:FKBP-type peptidyl-prolyl cis-trans isomerase SlyD